MQIDELHLTNFRCFDNTVIKFEPGFNIFIGDNATGKTAILDALSIGVGAIVLGFDGIRSRPVRDKDIRGVFLEHASLITREHQFPVVVKCMGQINGKKMIWHRTRSSLKGKTDRKDAQEVLDYGKSLTKQVRDGKEVILPVIAYYPTTRLWREKKESESSLQPGSRLLGYQDCLSASSDIRAIRSWWKRHEMISLQKQKKTFQLEAVHKAVTDVMSDVENVKFDLNHDELIIAFTDGTTHLFSSLSDGYRNILAMTADIAIRASTLNPFLADKAICQTCGIVLIDELDLHLHPKWQRQIVQDLRLVFPKIQFMVTTHAPQILTGAQSEEINILKNMDSRIQIHRYDIPPGLRVDQILTGEWFGLQSTLDSDTLELLEQHRKILRKTKLSEREKLRCTEIENILRQRLGNYADTSLERMALGVIAEITEQQRPMTSEDRQKIRSELLNRTRQKRCAG
ncbi:AAA family ATPase [Desulfobacterales bacterium HSG16]|nr:AAA family ATPase [Desulfobacterales bacterium HSG16]